MGEGGIVQLGSAVLLAEEKAKRMLGVVGTAAETAANAQTRIDVKAFRAIRVNEFYRGWPFPGDPVLSGIGVNAGCRIEQISEIRHYRIRRDSFEIGRDARAVNGIVHD